MLHYERVGVVYREGVRYRFRSRRSSLAGSRLAARPKTVANALPIYYSGFPSAGGLYI